MALNAAVMRRGPECSAVLAGEHQVVTGPDRQAQILLELSHSPRSQHGRRGGIEGYGASSGPGLGRPFHHRSAGGDPRAHDGGRGASRSTLPAASRGRSLDRTRKRTPYRNDVLQATHLDQQRDVLRSPDLPYRDDLQPFAAERCASAGCRYRDRRNDSGVDDRTQPQSRWGSYQWTRCPQLVGPRSCVAVGATNWASGQQLPHQVALIERLADGRWSIEKNPAAGRGTTSLLDGVSCPVADFCVEVGHAHPGSDLLAGIWNGRRGARVRSRRPLVGRIRPWLRSPGQRRTSVLLWAITSRTRRTHTGRWRNG